MSAAQSKPGRCHEELCRIYGCTEACIPQHKAGPSDALLAWRAGASLGTLRDLAEEMGIVLGSLPRWRDLARQAGRQSLSRRTYVQNVAWLRERRAWLRAALAKAQEAAS